jgi:6-pyruvoyltetrahydropterin/6-carboxytetrahydropterin synthase
MPKPKSESGPTYVLRVCDRFEAAHHLYAYRGRSEPVHGHSWKVEVVIETTKLNAEGYGFDFVKIKKALGKLVKPFHHADVNSIPPFDKLSPTTEHLARHFFEELCRRLPKAPISEVTVWEGPDCSATYRA